MKNYSTYTSYKKSEVDWLGEIPDQWNEKKGKYVFKNKKVLNKKLQSLNRLALTLKGVINRSTEDSAGLSPNDFRTYQLFEKDDLVFKLIDLENISTSRVGITHEDGIMSSAYIRLSLIDKNFNSKYFYYLYYDWYKKNIFNAIGSGVRSTLTSTDLLDLTLSFPEHKEQTAIANFLDKKTTETKEFIKLKEKSIELLKERKTAIINQAVTKGLDSNVAMKDSGIEWLDEIPKHWDNKPVGSFFYERKEKNFKMQENLVLSLSYGRVKRRKMDNKGLLPESFSTYQITYPGDIIFRLTDLQNDKKSLRNGLTIEKGIITSAYLCIYTNKKISSEFINYLFRIYDLKKVFYSFGGGIRQGAGYSDIRKIKVIFPKYEEQLEIVSFIKSELIRIDNLIGNLEKEIILIKEYQQSLVSEAVTGKIDVREEKL